MVGITGGIGSGKSTVSELLVARGAHLIDADRITRELQRPGEPVFAAMVDRFGPQIVAVDGSLDRQAVADIVFTDDEAKEALEKIVHPEVGRVMSERLAAAEAEDALVLLDIPLLAEGRGRRDMAGVIVVDTDAEVAVERLVRLRGFSEADARGRMAAQADRQDRLAMADHIVDNNGSLSALEPQIERCWEWMSGLAEASG